MSSQRYSETRALDTALGECLKEKEALRELNAELLKTLEMLLHSYEVHGFREGWCDFKEATQEAREAISKAEKFK